MASRPGEHLAQPPPAQPNQHYFSPAPTGRPREATIRLALPDMHLDLVTARGVFSPQRVDPGTKALLLGGPPLPSGAVDLADLGAGYGPIAVTLARRAPEATVWAIEVNERARQLCARNATAAGVGARVRVVAPGEVPGSVRFAALWSNPPIRIGKAALHELLSRWLGRLLPGGVAALVVQRHLGADSLARWLAGRGWAVERLSSKGGYRLLEVRPGSSGDPVATSTSGAPGDGS